MTTDIKHASAQSHAIAGLVEQGVLNEQQAAAVLAAIAVPAAGPEAHSGWVAELAAYLGGGLMLGGLFWVLAQSWDRLNQWGQVGVLATISVLLSIAGLLTAGRISELRATGMSARTRVVTVLLALAVIPVMPAVAIAMDGFDHQVVYGAFAAMLAAIAVYMFVPNAISVVAMGGTSIAVASSLPELFDESQSLSPVAVTWVLVGVAWGVVSRFGFIKPRALGFGVAAGFSLIGAQVQLSSMDYDWLAYLVTALISGACLALYPSMRHAVLIIAAVIGLTLAVPEAAYDWSDGKLQVAYIILIGGAVMVAASVAALRWRRTAPRIAA